MWGQIVGYNLLNVPAPRPVIEEEKQVSVQTGILITRNNEVRDRKRKEVMDLLIDRTELTTKAIAFFLKITPDSARKRCKGLLITGDVTHRVGEDGEAYWSASK